MNKKNSYFTDKNLIYPIAVFTLSLLIFTLLQLAKPVMHRTIENAHYLAFHTLLEFFSILFAFCISTVIFYVYREKTYLRSIIIATTFFISGWIDIFHTLCYKGMPDFITPSSASKATTFWIIARLIMAIGFFVSIHVKRDKTSRISRWIILSMSCIFILLIFYIITYQPNLLPAFYVEGQGLTPIKIYAEYFIIALQGITAFLYLVEYEKIKNKTTILFSTALIINIFSELCFTLYVSVYDLYNFMGHIYKILAYMVMFNILFVYAVRHPYQKLKEAKQQLRNQANNLEQEVVKAKRQILNANKRLYKDMEYARVIQQSMLPGRNLQFNGIEFFSALIPCETLSGDFFNVFEIDEDNIGIYLVDVSGHGISPSIMTIFTDRTILSNKLNAYKQQLLLSPSNMLKDLFTLYNQTKFPPEMYLLIFYGVYNKETRQFTYSSAGLNTQPLVISASGLKELQTEAEFPICKMGEHYQPDYNNKNITFNPGDKLFLYSDGLVEAKNRRGTEFTEDRLTEILKNNSSALPEEIFYEVFDRFTCYVLDEKLEDDVTFLLMHVK